MDGSRCAPRRRRGERVRDAGVVAPRTDTRLLGRFCGMTRTLERGRGVVGAGNCNLQPPDFTFHALNALSLPTEVRLFSADERTRHHCIATLQ